MFIKHRIINNTLYLYIDDKYEFGNFVNKNINDESIIDKIKKYIKDKKIKFDGTKVVLLLSGLMIGTIYLNNNIDVKNYEIYKGNNYVYNMNFDNIPEFNIENKIEEVLNEVYSDIKKDETVIEINTPSKDKSSNTISNDKNNNTNNKVIIDNKNSINSDIKTNVNTNNSQTSTAITNNKTNENIITKNDIIIKLHKSSGEVIDIALEEYLIGVVAAEMPASFNIEALKAQAIVARTYTMKLIESNRTITDTVTTQSYKDNDALKVMWQGSYNTYYNKIKTAVNDTKGIYITYNGNIIDAVYHSTSNGFTEDSINVWGNEFPYLKTVSSPWDTSASSFLRTIDITYEEISSKLGFSFTKDTMIEIISRDASNRISKIKIGDKEHTGVELRNLLGLRSADFDVTLNASSISITTRGYGHGVGMSQYGANGMANSGYNYDAILKHYYTGVELIKK